MNRKLITLLVVALLGACGGVLIAVHPLNGLGRGSFFHIVFSLWFALLFGLPAALIAAAAFLFSLRWYRNVLRWVATAALSITLVAGILVFSYVPGYVLARRDVHKAKRYCEELVPLLDAYKERTGHYPAAIDEVLPEDRPLPLLLKVRGFYIYHEETDSFVLDFTDPRGMMNGFDYNSDTRQWHEWS